MGIILHLISRVNTWRKLSKNVSYSIVNSLFFVVNSYQRTATPGGIPGGESDLFRREPAQRSAKLQARPRGHEHDLHLHRRRQALQLHGVDPDHETG